MHEFRILASSYHPWKNASPLGEHLKKLHVRPYAVLSWIFLAIVRYLRYADPKTVLLVGFPTVISLWN